jgi:sulfide:quinone oxidoreductase
MAGTETTPIRVLVAGGGVAGLEAVLALRDLAGDRCDVTMVGAQRTFTERPVSVGQPFGAGHITEHDLPELCQRAGARFHRGSVLDVDPERKVIRTAEDDELGYDVLLLALGARAEPAFENVTTFLPERDPGLLGGMVRDLEEGHVHRVAYLIPPGATWPLPAYELALLTAHQAWGAGREDAEVLLVTHEDAPLAVFGPEASAAVAEELAATRVTVETSAWVTGVDRTQPLVMHARPGDRTIEADRVVALPVLHGTAPPGIPADDDGFIEIDEHGRVRGLESVYAAGDGVAFGIKFGGLAAQQADAAAAQIAADAGAAVEPQPFHPVLRGRLLTGRGARWLRFDAAGGSGEGEVADHPLWWPPTKVSGRYIAAVLGDGGGELQDAPAEHGVPVEAHVADSDTP